eukprot:gnl/TRDRNA2_/TRDRNA2_129905_c3_seq1.p1 gnl/TRDRNA2_/TRDRNA2_129905_c3~~gnl/TRDRNA2_/TRDRNA2_129905_c3_seq1.p1  ORF type:complete len:486 (-),score=118.25 gnl/TRDRNA2_/TRDRNA2_129905_c3_seq1:122-1552(-)
MTELVAECKKRGLPAESNPKKEVLIERLRDHLVWGQLPLEELRQECVTCGAPEAATTDLSPRSQFDVAVAPSSRRAGDERKVLMNRLVRRMKASLWESRGIPVERLGSEQLAHELFQEAERLETISTADLMKEYSQLELPKEDDLDPRFFMERLKNVYVWSELPMPELIKECKASGVTSMLPKSQSPEEQRAELVNRLTVEMCMKDWEKKDVPVRRIDSVDRVFEVVEELNRLEHLREEALLTEYSKLQVKGETKTESIPRYLQLRRLKVAVVWRALPLHELRKECREAGTSVAGSEPSELVQRLIDTAFGVRQAAPPRQSGPQMPAGDAEAKAKARPDPRDPRIRQQQGTQGGFRATATGTRVGPQFSASGMPLPGSFRRPGGTNIPGSAHRVQPSATLGYPPKMLAHFKTLQIPPTLDPNELRKAYRTLALKYHPDKNPGELQEAAAQKFREVQVAYEALCEYVKTRGTQQTRR